MQIREYAYDPLQTAQKSSVYTNHIRTMYQSSYITYLHIRTGFEKNGPYMVCMNECLFLSYMLCMN
jgi:hypothetical protein